MYLLTLSTSLETVANAAIEITNPPKLDLSITISVIVALAAIISPIFTTWLNNRHQSKIKKMELDQQHFEQSIMYKRSVLENYLKTVGKFLAYNSSDNESEYDSAYLLALMYVTPDIYLEMLEIHKLISELKYPEALNKLEKLTPKLHALLQSM